MALRTGFVIDAFPVDERETVFSPRIPLQTIVCTRLAEMGLESFDYLFGRILVDLRVSGLASYIASKAISGS